MAGDGVGYLQEAEMGDEAYFYAIRELVYAI